MDITGLLKAGVNTVSIELTNTLRNLLDPITGPGEKWAPLSSAVISIITCHGWEDITIPAVN